MFPGKYPLLATFYSPSSVSDGIGNVSREQVMVGQAWVSVVSISGRQFLLPSGEQAHVTHKMSFHRPTFDVTATTTVSVAGRSFDVQFPLDTPGAAEVSLMCVEG